MAQERHLSHTSTMKIPAFQGPEVWRQKYPQIAFLD